MRPSRIVLLTALTVIGGTVLGRHFKPVGKLPGFNPAG